MEKRKRRKRTGNRKRKAGEESHVHARYSARPSEFSLGGRCVLFEKEEAAQSTHLKQKLAVGSCGKTVHKPCWQTQNHHIYFTSLLCLSWHYGRNPHMQRRKTRAVARGTSLGTISNPLKRGPKLSKIDIQRNVYASTKEEKFKKKTTYKRTRQYEKASGWNYKN